MAKHAHLESVGESDHGSGLRVVPDAATSAVHDDTRFIAGMLIRSLSADQVAELVRILQDPQE